MTFNEFNLNHSLLQSIADAGFEKASPIQQMTMEPILCGKDIFAQAETGSGKTAAFVLPILEQILRDGLQEEVSAGKALYAVLSPTRELAQQTDKVFRQFGKTLNISSCCVIGGVSIEKQKEMIERGVHILVATPGRLADLIKQKSVDLHKCKGVVFDEADRLFDMGFSKDIDFILQRTEKNRQLIMLSATNNQEVLRTAYKFNSDPEEIKLNEDNLVVDHIDHKLAMITQEEKFPYLVQLLREQEDAYAIIFCNTQVQTHSVAEWLISMGFKAKPISGRMPQNKRTKLMEDFRSKKVTILVCTDVAARGLDIKMVNLVVNYDLPLEASNYVHRIGRTGRAGEKGKAISFCAHEDCEYLDPIYELLDSKIEKMDIEDNHFATDICKKPYLDRKTLQVSDLQSSRTKEQRQRRDKDLPPRRPRVEKTAQQIEKIEKQNAERVDRRFIEKSTYKIDNVKSEVMNFLRIDDESLLDYNILNEGKRKYVLFGPKLTTYKFFVRTNFKKVLLPFIIPLIKKTQLSLYVKVSYRPDSLLISFSGKDEEMLTHNDFELIDSFEQLIRTYLSSRLLLSSELKIFVKCSKKRAVQNQGQKKDINNDKLIALSQKLKKKIMSSKQPIMFRPLNPAERRIVHQYFQDDQEVKTTSIGDGRLKKIELSLK